MKKGASRLPEHMHKRTTQLEFIDSVSQAIELNEKVSLVHAETGVGKTLGYLCVALDAVESGKKVIIATLNNNLMRQVANQLDLIAPDSYGMYFGIRHYPSAPKIKRLLSKNTYTSGTTSYLHSLILHKDTMDEFKEEYGEFPTELEEHLVICDYKEKVQSVVDARNLALSKNIVITTHASILCDYYTRGKVFSKDSEPNYSEVVLLVDEADAFVDFIEQAKFSRLSATELVNQIKEHVSEENLTDLIALFDQLSLICQENILCSSPETLKIVHRFLDEIDLLTDGDKKWQDEIRLKNYEWFMSPDDVKLRASSIKKLPQLVMSKRFLPLNIGRYLADRTTILTSGTLSIRDDNSGFDWAINCFGLREKHGILSIHSPEHYGSLKLHLSGANPDYPSVYESNSEGVLSEKWLNEVAKDIGNIKGNILVITSSHAESSLISEKLIEKVPSIGSSLHVHRSGESIKDCSKRFIEKGGILITAAGHTGLNLVAQCGGLAFDSMVITRLGLSPFNKDKINVESLLSSNSNKHAEEKKLSGIDYRKSIVRTIRRIRQAIGRGIRSSEHHCDVYILDPRFPLWNARGSRFSALRNAIPIRFSEAYKKASFCCDTNEKLLEVMF